MNEKNIFEILSEPNILKHWKKFKIEGRGTYNFNIYSFDILILSPRVLFNTARAVLNNPA